MTREELCRWVAIWAVGALALTNQGCTSARPDPGTEAGIARASGLAEDVVYRVEGGPLDEPSAGERLTLADAVGRAVRTDPGLQAALARVRMAMAEADQARKLPNPVLNVVLRWGPGPAQIEASLTEDLIRLLQTSRRAGAADKRLHQASAEALTVALDVVAEVQTRYAAVQGGERRLKFMGEQGRILGRLDEAGKAMLAAGEASGGEVAALGAQAAALAVDVADAELALRQDRLRLARLVGEPSGLASWVVDEWRPPTLEAGTEEVWIETALRHRPEVQRAEWMLAALGDDAALARSGTWDGLSIGADATRDGDWAAGPSVSTPVPIFDTGRARRRRADAAVTEARHLRTLAMRRVVEEVRIEHRALVDSRANMARVGEQLVPMERARLSQVEAAYRAGEADLASLLLAEQGVLAANARAVDVELTATLSMVRLHRAAGGPGVGAAIAGGARGAMTEGSSDRRETEQVPSP